MSVLRKHSSGAALALIAVILVVAGIGIGATVQSLTACPQP